MHAGVHFDYTTVGHVTIDVLADGTRRAGGSAFYSALQAARLGRRALILTRGVQGEIEQLLEPHREELALEVLPAQSTTTLATSGLGDARRQRVLAWAGPIADGVEVDTAILHLAPVARETPRSWRGPAGFIGLTPQGLARFWDAEDAEMVLRDGQASELAPERWDALVISERERAACAPLLARTRALGAVAAVTAQASPTTILTSDGAALLSDVAPLGRTREDLGAGDVFAAAFFVALSEGRSVRAAADFANTAAAIRLAGVGAQSIGDRAAIEARLSEAASAASGGLVDG